MHTIRILRGRGLFRPWFVLASLFAAVALEGCDSDRPAPYPELSQTLAVTHQVNGFTLIDFATRGQPLEEAQRCVRSRSGAVSCMAFDSDRARWFSQPVAAGNFKGPLCWVARWSRNGQGDEDGGYQNYRDPSCPTRWYDANGVIVPPTPLPGFTSAGEPVLPADEVFLELLSTRCFRGPQPDPQHGDPDDFTCRGTVRNVSKHALDAAKVKVLFRLPNGEAIDNGIRLETLPLQPGAKSTFEITYYSAPKGQVTASFWFETFGGQAIKHRDVRKGRK